MMPLGPILMGALGIGTHEFGLLVASYSFSAAVSGVLAATFVDLFERKRLLLISFALFALATLACGLAPSYSTLMLARGLAGIFGGIMGALIHTMIGDAIPFSRRARASGIVSSAFRRRGSLLLIFVIQVVQHRQPLRVVRLIFMQNSKLR